MACELSSRNPYGYDTYENDDKFVGSSKQQKMGGELPTHIAQKQHPWKRLYNVHTLSSKRHGVMHYDPRAPNDNLDFVVKSTYNQHEALFPNKNDVVLQLETVSDDHGRILKNRVKEVIEPKPTHPLKVVVAQKERQSIHSVSNAIGSSHSDTTNRGYSRKADGGFYCI